MTFDANRVNSLREDTHQPERVFPRAALGQESNRAYIDHANLLESADPDR
jgi:hypothetical protein